MQGDQIIYFDDINLTLTRVVFEYTATGASERFDLNLTLTRVVFESFLKEKDSLIWLHLTLTRVVFEWK